ncbi:hypothetical protein BDW22DRAFT_495766 [Trametopsis cervina]|nr:hypothetical protein BDW22DRAFT_495766 [Trametopsis cervina]
MSYPSPLHVTPSPTHTAVSLVDSEHVVVNMRSSKTSSQASPHEGCIPVAPARSPTPAASSLKTDDDEKWMPPADILIILRKSFRPDSHSKKTRIPRPSNAFMLFRSLMINNRLPECMGNRQQNISRVAGEVWNKLSDEVRLAWHEQAELYAQEHALRYPDYKFSPARKAPIKPKEEELEGQSKEDYIRHLREKYMGVMGPAVAPARKRKAKARKVKTEEEEYELSPKRTRSRVRVAPEEATVESSNSHTRAPTPASTPIVPPTSVPVPPWRAPRQAVEVEPAYDFLPVPNDFGGLAAPHYVGRTSPISMPPEVPIRRKAYHDHNKITSIPTYENASMSPAYGPGPGAYGTYAHDVLGLGELAYPTFYTPYHLAAHHGPYSTTTPVPSPSDASLGYPDYGFAFTNELFASLANNSGCIATSTLAELAGSSGTSHEEVHATAHSPSTSRTTYNPKVETADDASFTSGV